MFTYKKNVNCTETIRGVHDLTKIGREKDIYLQEKCTLYRNHKGSVGFNKSNGRKRCSPIRKLKTVLLKSTQYIKYYFSQMYFNVQIYIYRNFLGLCKRK